MNTAGEGLQVLGPVEEEQTILAQGPDMLS
jgi:hypothetical protein